MTCLVRSCNSFCSLCIDNSQCSVWASPFHKYEVRYKVPDLVLSVSVELAIPRWGNFQWKLIQTLTRLSWLQNESCVLWIGIRTIDDIMQRLHNLFLKQLSSPKMSLRYAIWFGFQFAIVGLLSRELNQLVAGEVISASQLWYREAWDSFLGLKIESVID